MTAYQWATKVAVVSILLGTFFLLLLNSLNNSNEPILYECVEKQATPRLAKVKWEEVTLKPTTELLEEEVTSEPSSNQVPNNVPLGSDSYWALESTRDLLKGNVASARRQFLKALKEVKKSDGWNSNNTHLGFTRSILVFMPGNLGKQHSREFRALFLSWIRVRQKQPKGFKTDLLVVTPKENVKRLSYLGCSTALRKNREEKDRCVIILYTPLVWRKVSDPLIEYKGYIDSMLCLAEYDGYQYDAMMRSDLDTFIMPGFAEWTPPSHTTLVVGKGGYGHNNANAHLKYVSKVLGLDVKDGLMGLGSTWFGDTRLMVVSAKLTIAVMRWIHTQEFSAFEKCCSGTLGWPHWHWAVLLLYGGHVALNQVASYTTVVVSSDSNGHMDFFSTSKINI